MIQIGDRVKTRYRGDIISGVVRNVYNFERGEIFVVDIGGELIKRTEKEIALVPKASPKTDEITITRGDFRRKFMETLDPKRHDFEDSTNHIALFVSGMIILEELEKELFGEK
jgi:hypothetical protein